VGALYHKICKRIFRKKQGGWGARGKSHAVTLAFSTPLGGVENAIE
jgi:hypothetical protein